MAKKLRTVTLEQYDKLCRAEYHLRECRDELRAGGAGRKLVDDVRKMLKRVEGAGRHAKRAFVDPRNIQRELDERDARPTP